MTTSEHPHTVQCPRCFQWNLISPDAAGFTCMQCNSSLEYRKCCNPYCEVTFSIPSELLTAPKIKCPTCKQSGNPRRFKTADIPVFDLSQMRELYSRNGIDPDTEMTFPGRSIMSGVLLQSHGIKGLATGGCMVIFGTSSALIVIGTLEHVTEVPLRRVTTLTFSGRGTMSTTTTTGGGFIGGGFGDVSSMAQGMLIAKALNLLSTHRVTTNAIETIVSFEWDSGGISLLNSIFTPPELTEQFQGVVDRLPNNAPASLIQHDERMSIDTSSLPGQDLVGQIERLAILHETGALTDDEFRQAKLHLLSSR